MTDAARVVSHRRPERDVVAVAHGIKATANAEDCESWSIYGSFHFEPFGDPAINLSSNLLPFIELVTAEDDVPPRSNTVELRPTSALSRLADGDADDNEVIASSGDSVDEDATGMSADEDDGRRCRDTRVLKPTFRCWC